MSLHSQLKDPDVQAALKRDHGGEGSDYGSQPEQRAWLRTQARQRNNLMRQFCKGVGYDKDGSETYRERYELIDWSVA